MPNLQSYLHFILLALSDCYISYKVVGMFTAKIDL